MIWWRDLHDDELVLAGDIATKFGVHPNDSVGSHEGDRVSSVLHHPWLRAHPNGYGNGESTCRVIKERSNARYIYRLHNSYEEYIKGMEDKILIAAGKLPNCKQVAGNARKVIVDETPLPLP